MGCDDSGNGSTKADTAKAITIFSFANPAATGIINEIDYTIEVIVPYGTNVTAQGYGVTGIVKEYVLRETGPAGGLIFYINPNASTDGWKYLEAWTADESGTTCYWGGDHTSVTGTSTAIGTGYNNPYNRMTGPGHPAAEVVRNATHGSKSDWFLPSKGELNMMYINLKSYSVGGLGVTDIWYWSSLEDTGNLGKVFFQKFDTGIQLSAWKLVYKYYVRAVRSF